MKKYFSLLSFIAIFFIGMQISLAQEADRQDNPEVVAKQKTYELHQLLKLTGKQQGAMFDVLVDAEKNIIELNKNKVSESVEHERMKAINEKVQANFKKILTPEQFQMYQASLVTDKK